MNFKICLLTLCLSLAWAGLRAQPKKASPEQMAKQAAEFEKTGDFQNAGTYYQSAHALKPDKLDWAYKAGRAFMEIRDYENAAKSFAFVKDQHTNKNYDKPALKYALALKQTGAYEEAKTAFENFMRNYNGADANKWREIVDTEIKGCNFGARAKENADANISITLLDANVNTDKTEFAPIPFGNDVLYFSSTVSGHSKIYRTQKKDPNGNSWIPRQSPSLFAGKMEKPHFGNGSFTPDGKRFYFTQCEIESITTPRCAIYLMVEEDNVWSNPIRLPDYINVEGATTTQPFVTIVDDKEILYFSSNRDGGRGGMDIWYSTRVANSRGNNFTLPKNLGININTPGDEITPYYDTETQTLFFSSNGWQSAGGLDVFKSQGAMSKWEVAQNMGFPVNSAADDLYYIVSRAHGGGYLVSNRVLEPLKMSTTNEDIFHFGQMRVEVTLQGKIYDKKSASKEALEDISLRLFEISEEGSEELVSDRMLAVGEYKIVLEPKKKYVIEFAKEGYSKVSFEVNTNDFHKSEIHQKDIALEVPSMTYAQMLALVVPPAYNSPSKPYTLPNDPPIDPFTKRMAAEGSPLYNVFREVQEIAAESPSGQVHYSGAETVVAYVKPAEPVVAKTEPKPTKPKPEPKKPEPKPEPKPTAVAGPIQNFSDYSEAEKGVVFKVQVAAVRKYREQYYKPLQNIPGYKLDFEMTDGGLTRVMLVPEEANEDGSVGFRSKAKALDLLIYSINNTRFDKSFVIRYENGERVGEGFRGWDDEDKTDNK